MKNLRELLGAFITDENRENWCVPENFDNFFRSQIPQSIKIVKLPPRREMNYNCFMYTFGMANSSDFLGSKGRLVNSKAVKGLIENKVLEPCDEPRMGDIVIYFDKEKEDIPVHAGIFDGEDYVISKWSCGPIFRHKTFDLPEQYGDKVKYYRQVSLERVIQHLKSLL